MSNKNSFATQTVVIKSSQATVFKALTDAKELTRWFPSRAESDPRAGGMLKLYWDFADASQNGLQEGEYVEVIPNTMLSYTWKAENVPTLVSIKLAEVNGETTLDLDHASLQEDADLNKLREGHINQWMFFLMNLKGYLEGGMDLREEKLKQVTN